MNAEASKIAVSANFDVVRPGAQHEKILTVSLIGADGTHMIAHCNWEALKKKGYASGQNQKREDEG